MQEFLRTIAPTLASALLGPLAGVAVAGLGKIFGIEDATQEKIAKVIQSGKLTSEQLAEIQKLEMQYQAEEKERGFRYAEIACKDRDSARQMQIATKSQVPATLALLITLGFFGILGYMLTDSYQSTDPLLVMLGSLGTAWIQIVAFYFGSSASSHQKNELLYRSKPT